MKYVVNKKLNQGQMLPFYQPKIVSKQTSAGATKDAPAAWKHYVESLKIYKNCNLFVNKHIDPCNMLCMYVSRMCRHTHTYIHDSRAIAALRQ